MAEKKDIIRDAGSYAVIGGMAGLGLATLTDDTTYPNYEKAVDKTAVMQTVEEALKNRPDPTKMNPQEFAEADKKWVESIAQNALQNKEAIQQERDAPKKAADDRKARVTFGGMAGGGSIPFLVTGFSGWRNRQEKKKAEKSAQGNDGKSV